MRYALLLVTLFSTYLYVQNGNPTPHISVDNTTYAPLSGGATYTGTWVDVTHHTSVVTAVQTNGTAVVGGFDVIVVKQ